MSLNEQRRELEKAIEAAPLGSPQWLKAMADLSAFDARLRAEGRTIWDKEGEAR